MLHSHQDHHSPSIPLVSGDPCNPVLPPFPEKRASSELTILLLKILQLLFMDPDIESEVCEKITTEIY